jgi:hypothetical protein
MKARIALVIGLVFVCAAGCEPRPDPEPRETGTRPSSTASLAIKEPQPGAQLIGAEITVKLELTGGTIVQQASRSLSPDKGHIHLRLDGTTITLLGGLEERVKVTPGPHVLEVEFVAADHNPFHPRVLTTTTFTVTS